MYEEIKKRIYSLFISKSVQIDINRSIEYANFCCLKIMRYPTKGVTLITGKFSDDLHETLLIAHEYGHLLHYESLSREEAEITYCAILASNHIGLENISVEGKNIIISVEKKASEHALTLLQDISDEKTIMTAKDTYNQWIQGYFKKAKLKETESLFL